MSLPSAPVVRNVFRACVVTAVRESEALMAQLLAATRTALAKEEAETRNVTQRDTASDALRLLDQHEAALLKAYPMPCSKSLPKGQRVPKPAKLTRLAWILASCHWWTTRKYRRRWSCRVPSKWHCTPPMPR